MVEATGDVLCPDENRRESDKKPEDENAQPWQFPPPGATVLYCHGWGQSMLVGFARMKVWQKDWTASGRTTLLELALVERGAWS